jgi:hypothetical protein
MLQGGDIRRSVDISPAESQILPFNSDRWGYYQAHGADRHAIYNSWVDQTPASDFDPGAWQLKWIKLPSGGEIHVQYEQNDYRYVQDHEAYAMVHLKQEPSAPHDRVYLDINSDLGVVDNTGSDEAQKLVKKLRRIFIDDHEHIYFKFLYGLDNRAANLTNCTSEYVDGYVNVRDVGIDQGGVFVKLGSDDAGQRYTLPQQVAWDFRKKNRGGDVFDPYGGCSASLFGIPNTPDEKPQDYVLSLLGQFGNDYFDEASSCLHIDPSNSYLRLPMTRAKKGGGIRVKRILMYDKGLESANGEAALYGSEYLYLNEDGQSSGVATNEPTVGRNENSLVNLITKRTDQNTWERITSGLDKTQTEGPLGESLLPAPSVGYSRVVVKSLHGGKTGTGYSVHEFYTAKDYPFDLQNASAPTDLSGLKTAMTPIQQATPEMARVACPAVSYSVANLWMTQGFRFVLTSMHGRPKSIASFGGDYGGKSYKVQQQTYEYFQPGEKIPVMAGPLATDIVMANPGKEMEVVFDSRSVEDVSHDDKLQLDFGMNLLLIPLPFGSAAFDSDFGEKKLRQHVTTKIIRYPVVQKRMIVVKDGMTKTMEYVAFNPETGQPALVKSTDEYDGLSLKHGSTTSSHDGSVYTYTIPATAPYPGLGQKAIAERALIQSGSDLQIDKRYADGRHTLNFTYRRSRASNLTDSLLMAGDLVEVMVLDGSGNVVERLGVYHVGKVFGNKVEILPTSSDFSFNVTSALKQNVSVEIIRSGRVNRLDASAGEIRTYGRQPQLVNHSGY